MEHYIVIETKYSQKTITIATLWSFVSLLVQAPFTIFYINKHCIQLTHI